MYLNELKLLIIKHLQYFILRLLSGFKMFLKEMTENFNFNFMYIALMYNDNRDSRIYMRLINISYENKICDYFIIFPPLKKLT